MGKKLKKSSKRHKAAEWRHKMFVKHYCSNGNNATQAYLSVYKGVTYNTAHCNGVLLIQRNASVKAAIDKEMERQVALIDLKSIASRESLILEAHEIGEKAKKADKLDTALRSVDQKARLTHMYIDKPTENKYNVFINNVFGKNESEEFEEFDEHSDCDTSSDVIDNKGDSTNNIDNNDIIDV